MDGSNNRSAGHSGKTESVCIIVIQCFGLFFPSYAYAYPLRFQVGRVVVVL